MGLLVWCWNHGEVPCCAVLCLVLEKLGIELRMGCDGVLCMKLSFAGMGMWLRLLVKLLVEYGILTMLVL